MFVKYMLQLRQGVKNTPAHAHELYSCWYNMLVYSEYMSWYDTFGLKGPWALPWLSLERYLELTLSVTLS